MSIRRLDRCPVEMLPALRRAEAVLGGQERGVGRRPVRVPLDAVVGVRTRPALPAPPPTLRLGASPSSGVTREAERSAPTANDNGPPQVVTRSRVRAVLRELAALALLAVTLAAVYYVGRMHAFQNVIVVPEPWSTRSMLG